MRRHSRRDSHPLLLLPLPVPARWDAREPRAKEDARNPARENQPRSETNEKQMRLESPFLALSSFDPERGRVTPSLPLPGPVRFNAGAASSWIHSITRGARCGFASYSRQRESASIMPGEAANKAERRPSILSKAWRTHVVSYRCWYCSVYFQTRILIWCDTLSSFWGREIQRDSSHWAISAVLLCFINQSTDYRV